MRYLLLLIAGCLVMSFASAQSLAPDQNPRYHESLRRYLPLADSLNRQHSTTLQQTYKAYDFMELKRERKEQRRLWRHERRMERSRYGNYWYSDPYYNNYYNYGYPVYNRGNYWNNNWGSYLTATSLALGVYCLFH